MSSVPSIPRALRGLALGLALIPARMHAQAPCDPNAGLILGFQLLGAGYTYSFSALPAGQAVAVTSAQWAFVYPGAMQPQFGPSSELTFPGPGIYGICIHASVTTTAQDTCSLTHCELFPVPVDSACDDLLPGFTISIQGQSLQFLDHSLSQEPINAYAWDFGDGTTSTQPNPIHDFSGAGPYEVCLTVTAGNCTATTCNWVYFGPEDVPCGTLLQADMDAVRIDRTVVCFDKSITSGMNEMVSWDFGDGAQGLGGTATHTYMDDADRTVCSFVHVWGPLTSDTCTAEVCKDLPGFTAAGIHDEVSGTLLRAGPTPFADVLELRGTAVRPGARWALLDMSGRTVDQGSITSRDLFSIHPSTTAVGPYLLRLTSEQGVTTVRVLKQ